MCAPRPPCRLPGMQPLPESRSTTYLKRPFEYPAESKLGELISRGQEWDAVLGPIIQALVAGPAPFMCEVGSNIGSSTRQLLKAAPGAQMLCFEPSNRFRSFLERNLFLAGHSAEVLPYIVGKEAGVAVIHSNETSGTVLPAPHLPTAQESPMVRLDDVLEGRPPLDFLKVDTDGFDFEVLLGAEQTIRRDRPVIFFEYAPSFYANGEGVSGLRQLQAMGYRRLHLLDPAGKYLLTTQDAEEAHARSTRNQHGTYCDILACASGSPAELRQRTLLPLRPGRMPTVARRGPLGWFRR